MMIADLLILVSAFFMSDQAGPAPVQPAARATWARTLTFAMRGEVRLLLFWVGRDNVGGGRIAFSRGAEGNAGRSWQETEVLFGSHPERIPGKVNMWGYGKERSIWKPAQDGGQELVQSVFEGFMRPEGEYPANMQDYQKRQQAQDSFLYKAIRSEVDDRRTTTEIRFFAEKEDFNYRSPEALLLKFEQNLSSTKPEVRRELSRQAADYEIPAGFLTAAQHLLARVSNQAARDPKGWTTFRAGIRYAYHAKPYRLSLRRIASARGFQTSAAGTTVLALQDIAEADFRIENLKDGFTYDFTLWFALRGPMQGLPLRILYQPKWWLRLKLDLTGLKSND